MDRSAAMRVGSTASGNCSPPKVTPTGRPNCRSPTNRLHRRPPLSLTGARGMGESEIIDGRGRFQRVIEFPLVAMLLAIAIFLAIPGMVAGLLEILFRAHPVTGSAVINQLIVSIAMVLTYKLFIRHLGADPRDDLAGPGAAKQTSAGLAIGF